MTPTRSATPRYRPTSDHTAANPTGPATGTEFAAVILDMDGVVTDIAGLHAAAWKNLFDPHRRRSPVAAMSRRSLSRPTTYYAYVDGRSREDGVGVFLASRNLRPPQGSAGDPPGTLSVQWVAAHKQHLAAQYRQLVAQHYDLHRVRVRRWITPQHTQDPERSPTPLCERPH